MDNRAESSRSSKAYGIRNLHGGTPEIRELHTDNYQLEMQKADADVGFIVEGSKLTKFLSVTADGVVTEQPLPIPGGHVPSNR